MLAMMMPPFTPHLMLDACVHDMLAVTRGCSISDEQPLVEEHDDAFKISARAAGVSAADLKVKLEDGVVTLRGETRGETQMHFVKYAVALPAKSIDRIDVDASSASHVDGVLTVHLPKKATETAGADADELEIPVSAVAMKKPDAEDHDASTHYHISANAAGIAAVDMTLKAQDGVLRVSGKTERTGASIERAYRLPRDVDVKLARASHVDGILRIELPKRPALPARYIEVTAGSKEEREPARERQESAAPAESAAGDDEKDGVKWMAEWDELLDELSEMGFTDVESNRSALLKTSGSIKLAVRELVSARQA